MEEWARKADATGSGFALCLLIPLSGTAGCVYKHPELVHMPKRWAGPPPKAATEPVRDRSGSAASQEKTSISDQFWSH